jgi:predicted heme/steroid binding protein
VYGDDFFMETSGRKFTLDELKQYDGKDGRPAYVAYKGNVYDVTEDPLWSGGEHQGVHEAGKDLTDELASAPHMEEVFALVKLIGSLILQ